MAALGGSSLLSVGGSSSTGSSSPAVAASRAQVVASPMPDLSHLTEDERRIIESVLMRQRREEEQETENVRYRTARISLPTSQPMTTGTCLPFSRYKLSMHGRDFIAFSINKSRGTLERLEIVPSFNSFDVTSRAMPVPSLIRVGRAATAPVDQ